LRNVDKKVITFSAPPPIKKVHQGVAFGALKGTAALLIAKEILDM
jgi:hypothetical protein